MFWIASGSPLKQGAFWRAIDLSRAGRRSVPSERSNRESRGASRVLGVVCGILCVNCVCESVGRCGWR